MVCTESRSGASTLAWGGAHKRKLSRTVCLLNQGRELSKRSHQPSITLDLASPPDHEGHRPLGQRDSAPESTLRTMGSGSPICYAKLGSITRRDGAPGDAWELQADFLAVPTGIPRRHLGLELQEFEPRRYRPKSTRKRARHT